MQTGFKKYALLLFFCLAFAISVPAFLALTPTTPAAVQLLLLIVGSYAPALSALAVLAAGRQPGEGQAVKRRLGLWRLGWRAYLIAGLVPCGIWLGAAAAYAAAGNSLSFQAAGFVLLPVIFLTNLGEEIGWRGYALPRLMRRWRPLTASLVLGLIWGVFHLALYWQRPLFAALFFPLMTGISVVLTWLFVNNRGSVILCTFFHAVFNAWSQSLLPAQGSERLLALVVIVLWIAAGFLVLRYGAMLSKTPAAVEAV